MKKKQTMMRAVQASLLTALMLAGAATLTLTGCPGNSPSDPPPETAATAAAAFQTSHSVVLGKTVDTVAIADETAVIAALTAYNALSADAKALLVAEKSKLDELKAKVDELKAVENATPEDTSAAAAFKTAHSEVLAKTVDTVTIADEADVTAALTAYNGLSAGAKPLVSVEKNKLDTLKARIDALKAAESFKTTHSVVLAKTMDTVAIADEAAVTAAITAYNDLSAEAKALLSAEKSNLDALKAKVDALKAAENATPADTSTATAFKTAHSVVLGKTVDTVAIADEAAVTAALTAYNALSAGAKLLVSVEKNKLDILKAKIDELKAAAGNPAQEAADTFKTTHAAILAKTVDTVAISDEADVDAALASYGALSADAKGLLTAEKTLLDSLKAKIEALKAETGNPAQEAADTFKTTHAVILEKTVDTVAISDEADVDTALAAYELLSADAKDLLTAEKTLLDSLKAKIDELKANQTAADAFKTTHAAILAETVDTVAISDEAAVDAALAAYELLSADAKDLLTAEKTLLDSLKVKIDTVLAATGSTVTVNLWTNDTTVLATADKVTLSRAASETALITGLSGTEYTNHQWSINGSDVAAPEGTAETFSFDSAGKGNGKYNIELQVKKDNAWYSTTITITVTN
ncbi:hypothetical protein AGMMS4952_04370 [Spirochaetia bacterium]|nr:hypothetical protein AGMMS4952_04370 [Spirochaetia bacterium]